jgi:mRNA interferase YafQ
MSVPQGRPPHPPLALATSEQFDRDLKRLDKKRHRDMHKIHTAIGLLRNRLPLPRSHREHALKGDWRGFFECHVGGEGDWLLIHKRTATTLHLVRTGSHDELFR